MPDLRVSELAIDKLVIHMISLGGQLNVKLSKYAATALLQADCVLGTDGQLARINHYLNTCGRNVDTMKYQPLPAINALKEKLQILQALNLTNIVVLVSEAVNCDLGVWLNRHFCAHQIYYYSAISETEPTYHS